MPTLTFVQPNGERQRVDAPLGMSVMQAAVQNGIPGILAECGGHLACGTCHVYVDKRAYPRFPPAQLMEREMLGFAAAGALHNSRLSCQLIVTDALDGAEFHVPTHQI